MSTTVFAFTQRSLPTGDFTIPSTALPAGTLKMEVRLALCTTATPTIWPNPATTLAIAMQVSYDNGASWVGGGGVTGMAGGIQHNFKTGAEIPFGGFVASFPTPPTHVRGTLTVANGPLVTSGSVLVN